MIIQQIGLVHLLGSGKVVHCHHCYLFGVKLGDTTISIILYADDIALVFELEDLLNTWPKMALKYKLYKTDVIHFRKMSENKDEFELKNGNNIVQKVNKYKYLGGELNYWLNFPETMNILATASSRSIGSLVHKYYSSNRLYSNTHKTLYDAIVCKIMDCDSAV